MFSKNFGLMLYVDDVATEKNFWLALGFVIIAEQEMLGYDSFEMKNHADSNVTITVYDKAFIQQVSPEVVNNQPSLLFETDDLETLHAKVVALTDTASPINQEPFKNFNFASPIGQYYAVREVK